MSVTWQDFSSPGNGTTLDSRFFLPVDFFVDINYINTAHNIDSVQRIANLVGDTVMSVLKGRPGCELHVLKWTANRAAMENPISDIGEQSYFTLEFPNPVYGFAIQVGPKTTRITKGRANIQDIIATIPIFDQLCQRLFVA